MNAEAEKPRPSGRGAVTIQPYPHSQEQNFSHFEQVESALFLQRLNRALYVRHPRKSRKNMGLLCPW